MHMIFIVDNNKLYTSWYETIEILKFREELICEPPEKS